MKESRFMKTEFLSPTPEVIPVVVSLKNEKSTPVVISYGVGEMFIVEPHETRPTSEAVYQSLHCKDLIKAGVLQLINS